jgi:hypothetical protein
VVVLGRRPHPLEQAVRLSTVARAMAGNGLYEGATEVIVEENVEEVGRTDAQLKSCCTCQN